MAPSEIWDMRIEEALRIAVEHSKVILDAGGRVLVAPSTVQTAYDPAIIETNPLSGPAAALSAFNAQFASTTFWRAGNNFFNSSVLGGGTLFLNNYFLNTDVLISDQSVTKRTATGAILRMDTNTEYFSVAAPFNASGLESTAVGGTIVQPLLRGAGTDFNRIAGSSTLPGVYNGVVISRLNTDISLVDFETAVRGLLIDVERAYWDLSLAYRDLDAKIAARDATLQTWRLVYRKLQIGAVGGDEENEARVREQFYVLQAQVENAYSGAPPVTAALGGTEVMPPSARHPVCWAPNESFACCSVCRRPTRGSFARPPIRPGPKSCSTGNHPSVMP